MNTYTYDASGFQPKRLASTAVAVLLHIGIGYVLLVATANKLRVVLQPETIVEVIEEKKRPVEEVKPKLSPPKLQQPPPLMIPLPEVDVQQPAPPAALHAVMVTALPPPTRPAPPVQNEEPPPLDQMEQAWLDTSKCEQPVYPYQLMNHEQGDVLLGLLVDVDGKVLDSRIERSSGYKLLDEAAREAMVICRYRPGKLNGQTYKSWKKLKVVWELPF